MKTIRFLFFTLAALSLTVFISCEKDEEELLHEQQELPPTSEEALNAIQEYVLVNKLFSDAANETDAAAKETDNQIENGDKGYSKSYPVITIEPFDTVTWPKNVTVDYGETNFLCEDGRYRRGVINFEITNWYHLEGTVLTVTLDDYYQDDHKLDGTKIITNEGRNNDDNLVYSVVINDGVVITPDNKSIYYEQNTTREWTEGEETPLIICDDVYLIDGTQTGISSDSINYSLTIQQRLDVRICCKWIRDGILDVDIEGLPTITIDYSPGDEECNNNVVVTILGQDYPIEMQ